MPNGHREMLLLGAGASIEAGVPGAYGMTNKLIEQVSADPTLQRQTHLLRFVAGGLMFQSGVWGNDPFAGVNVEDLFSAVQLLGTRGTLEAAPFVGSWHPMVEEFDRAPPERIDVREIRRRLGEQIADDLGNALPTYISGGAGREIDRVFEEWSQKVIEAALKNKRVTFRSTVTLGQAVAREVQSILTKAFEQFKKKSRAASDDVHLSRALGEAVDQRRSRPAGGKLFAATNKTMIQFLANLVWIEDSSRIEYLSPILVLLDHQPRLTVATLNYDNGVEKLCESRSITYETGIVSWSEKGTFPPPSEGVELLKLHGSIDWRLVSGETGAAHPMPHRRIEKVDMANRSFLEPALIFGQRNKLTAEGPFLDLLRTFRERLFDADRLTVLGYSFRDGHINEYITQWLNGDAMRRLRIIDPAFKGSREPYPVALRRHCSNRLDVVQAKAGEGLLQAFSHPRSPLTGN